MGLPCTWHTHAWQAYVSKIAAQCCAALLAVAAYSALTALTRLQIDGQSASFTRLQGALPRWVCSWCVEWFYMQGFRFMRFYKQCMSVLYVLSQPSWCVCMCNEPLDCGTLQPMFALILLHAVSLLSHQHVTCYCLLIASAATLAVKSASIL